MRALVVEFRRSSLAWSLPVLLAAGLLAAETALSPGVADWGDTSAAIAASAQLMAPVAAGWAAWAGAREHRRRVTDAALLSTRPRLAGASRELAATLLWVAVAYAVVALVLVVQTALGATGGVPELSWVAVGGLGLGSVAGCAWVLGRLLPYRATPPLAAVASFVLGGVLATSSKWVSLASPVVLQEGSSWLHTRPVVFAGEALLYLGVFALALVLWAVLQERREFRRVVAGLGAVAAIVGLVGTTLIYQADRHFYGAARIPSYTCAAEPLEVCVVSSFRPGLPVIEAQLSKASARLAMLGLSIPRVQQLPRGRGGAPPIGSVALNMDDLAPATVRIATTQVIAKVLTSGPACSAAGARESLFNDFIVGEFVGWVAQDPSLAGLAGEQPEVSRWFAGLTDAQRGEWLRSNLGGLRSCTVTSSALH